MKVSQPVHLKALLGWKTGYIDLQFAGIKTDPESNRLRNTQMLDEERRDVGWILIYQHVAHETCVSFI